MNNNLREIRINALGLSEEDLAQKLGVSQNEYKCLEAESVKKNQVDLVLLNQLANATGLLIDELVNRVKTKVEFTINDNWNSVKSFKNNFNSYMRQNESLFRKDDNFVKKSKTSPY